VVERSFQMIRLNEAKQKARLAASDSGSLLEDELGVLAAVAFNWKNGEGPGVVPFLEDQLA
jgi:hypothetical protein